MPERYEIGLLARGRSSVTHVALYLLLGVLAIFSLAPLLLAFSNSFKPWTGFMKVPPEWIPLRPTLDNYKFLFVREFYDITGAFQRSPIAPYFWRWIFNTLFVAVVVTSINVFVGTLSGYAFAKMRSPDREFLFWLNMAMLVFPGIFNLVPVYLMMRDWGWLNTYWGLIIPQLGGNMFLSRQYMKRLPSPLVDSARMDGCSEFKIYSRVILPLSKPLVAILAIFGFTGQWYSFKWPLIVTTKLDLRTIQLGLAVMAREAPNMGVLMAGAIVTAIPIFIIFFLFQDYFMKGLTVGAIKG